MPVIPTSATVKKAAANPFDQSQNIYAQMDASPVAAPAGRGGRFLDDPVEQPVAPVAPAPITGHEFDDLIPKKAPIPEASKSGFDPDAYLAATTPVKPAPIRKPDIFDTLDTPTTTAPKFDPTQPFQLLKPAFSLLGFSAIAIAPELAILLAFVLIPITLCWISDVFPAPAHPSGFDDSMEEEKISLFGWKRKLLALASMVYILAMVPKMGTDHRGGFRFDGDKSAQELLPVAAVWGVVWVYMGWKGRPRRPAKSAQS